MALIVSTHHIDCNNGIKEEYSPYALQQSRNILAWKYEDNAYTRKLVTGISIDWATSKDLDDALYAEKLSNWWYKLSIHIADPTSVIPIFSPLDLEALDRSVSIYRENSVLNMYPPELSEEYFSLIEWSLKRTLSFDIFLSPSWNVENFVLYESLFENMKRYNYENFLDDFIDINSQNYELLRLLFEIALKRRKIRKNKGAIMNFDETDRRLTLSDKAPSEYKSDINKQMAHTIVEESAILGNICAALYMTKHHIQSIFRVHAEVSEKAQYSLKHTPHLWLSEEYYTHYTSPIRRYADGMVHRLMKSHLSKEESPYKREHLEEIIKHINNRVFQIERFQNTVNFEKGFEAWGEQKTEILRKLHGNNLKTYHFKEYIRRFYSEGHKMPTIMKEEILQDIAFWNVESWIWSLGILLLSQDNEILNLLSQKILTEEILPPKKVLSVLAQTKKMRWDQVGIYTIEETLTDESYTIDCYFFWRKTLSFSEDYSNTEDKQIQKYNVRKKMIQAIFESFNTRV